MPFMRTCVCCGKPMINGMTNEWEFYAHEHCFEKAMNEEFGAGNWRITEDDGKNGCYEYTEDDGKTWYGTGIHYTEWDD